MPGTILHLCAVRFVPRNGLRATPPTTASDVEINVKIIHLAHGEPRFRDVGPSRIGKASREFLGAECIGPDAEHIARLLAWALQMKLTVDAMLAMLFYHPVVEEGAVVRSGDRKVSLKRNAERAVKPVRRCAFQASGLAGNGLRIQRFQGILKGGRGERSLMNGEQLARVIVEQRGGQRPPADRTRYR